MPPWLAIAPGRASTLRVLGEAFGRPTMSASVKVFGCRHDDAIHALLRPASEKRQGTKSREVGHWRCRGRYGDLIAAPGWRVDATPRGCGRRISPLARLEAYN